MNAPLRIGTRGSPLALWQAHFVADRLRSQAAPREVEIVRIQTHGDEVQTVPLATLGGEGVFTKAIQDALLAGDVDVAVHSLKDLPTVAVPGLTLAAVPPRGAVGDVFVSQRHAHFDDLPQGATLATSSLRRRAQALHRRPDLRAVEVRGNVQTRLRKLADDGFDALILAQAGLERLGLERCVTEILDSTWMLPAVGQGALGIECRHDDEATLALVAALDDGPTHQAVLAERTMLAALGGGCRLPIAALSRVEGSRLTLRGVVLSPDGRRRISQTCSGPLDQPRNLGAELAADLINLGAKELLA